MRGLAANSPIRRGANAQIIILIQFPIFVTANQSIEIMAKGPEKNTKNKALHTKLLNKKKAKIQEEKKAHALRLKALVAKMNEKKNNDESDVI